MDANEAPVRAAGRAPLIFAVAGVVVALIAGALFLFRDAAAPPLRSPEETAREFLSGVFLAASPERVGAVVCAGWDPAEAIARTAKEIDPDVHVSWDEFRTASTTEDRTTIRVRIGLRAAGETRPSAYQQWRIHLVNEDGWRVCEARPLVI